RNIRSSVGLKFISYFYYHICTLSRPKKDFSRKAVNASEGKHRMLRFPHPRRRGIGVRFTAALAVALTISGFGVSSASADANFRKWVAGFRNTAIQSGVTPSTFDLAFKGVTAPDP